ncbi:MAG: red chlorophyll catabolite reductase [Elainellaceae cyanobacterium]
MPKQDLNQAIVFERLQTILNELYGDVTHHLDIVPKSQQPFQSFSSPDGNVTGSLLTFTGKQVDKLVYSWLNAAQLGFGTMRLTLWLSPNIQVPHLAFEFGTIPNLFFYMDYIPRVDLWTDLSYTEKYYESASSTYLELRNNPDLSLFVSKGLYVRQLQSPAHLCFTCSNTEDSLSLIHRLAHEMSSRWLAWVDQATPLPADMRASLAERDLSMRRISAERDPGNAMAAKIFGTEFANQLVQSLWNRE